ncbi:solute carrier family 25 member 40-like protein [Basidiobolus meristosporus CBS 931.73]|uniref:Solute carrier family 25 member 40-like protein n=1 Tax=Basidiobolus meristosporus CBS 931.73 TaxID=1314790 RepID=A0A1Y1XVA6_9FUNG|nr:solute carrier family 25 member 40-like protein [Basidiobolus meristosporus CBS 931.73]|eukprot:ORX89680.1 solute carrier family 25 member 40-like protein [Basidiobolus meristosporus CBS 931.73]
MDKTIPITPVQKMVSACSGALITSILVTPLDVVKTRLQSQTLNQRVPKIAFCYASPLSVACIDTYPTVPHRGFAACRLKGHSTSCTPVLRICASDFAVEDANKQFKGTWDGVVKIVRNEGFTKLWKGLSPTLLMQIPATAIYYVGYDHMRDFIKLNVNDPNIDKFSPLIVGSLARTCAATCISPIELIRTRVQSTAAGTGLSEVMSGVAKMVKNSGASSLWRGLSPTLWRDVPFSGIYWMGYESIKTSILNQRSEEAPLTPSDEFELAFVAGALSGSIAAVLTTPFDVAKTRIQVDSSNDTLVNRKPRMFDIMKSIARNEGIGGLFTGLIPRVAKVAPSCAIMISSYEVGKALFRED